MFPYNVVEFTETWRSNEKSTQNTASKQTITVTKTVTIQSKSTGIDYLSVIQGAATHLNRW